MLLIINNNIAAIDECVLFDLGPSDTVTVTVMMILGHELYAKDAGTYQLNIMATTAEGLTTRKTYIAIEEKEDQAIQFYRTQITECL